MYKNINISIWNKVQNNNNQNININLPVRSGKLVKYAGILNVFFSRSTDILPRLKHVGFWRCLAFFKHCVVGYQCSHRVHLFLYTINHAFLTECDVECCIHIGMINVPANRTLKLLSSPLTSSTTPRAILRCVCRVNVENRDAKQLGFVFYELL